MNQTERPDPNHHAKVVSLCETYLAGLRACPEIVHAGHPTLRRRATEIGAQDTAEDTFRRLRETLERYRAATGVGRGLAAPQIGIPSRAFVTFLDGDWRFFLNPRMDVRSEGRSLYRESCLSCGPISVDVARPTTVLLKWQTPSTGAACAEIFTGFAARLVQHEMDHLDGILCVDRAEIGSLNLRTENPLEEEFRPVS